MKALILPIVCFALIGGILVAQPYGGREGPLEAFLGRIGRDNANVPLDCVVRKRINRVGDIVWINMECRSDRYGR